MLSPIQLEARKWFHDPKNDLITGHMIVKYYPVELDWSKISLTDMTLLYITWLNDPTVSDIPMEKWEAFVNS